MGMPKTQSRPRSSTSLVSSVAARNLLATLVLLACTSACYVPPPTAQQRLDYGFDTPLQAFESFRTAVQGNQLSDEYRCFSRGWREATGAESLSHYSEARDRALEKVPQLRAALHRAEDPEITVMGRSALLVSRIAGPLWVDDRWLVMRLDLEGYWDVWTKDQPKRPTEGLAVQDPVAEGFMLYDDETGSYRVIIDYFADETGDLDPAEVWAVKAGWWWKVGDFYVVDDPEMIPQVIPQKGLQQGSQKAPQ